MEIVMYNGEEAEVLERLKNGVKIRQNNIQYIVKESELEAGKKSKRDKKKEESDSESDF